MGFSTSTPTTSLPNMWASAFPPRRPSALLRYVVPAVFLLACLYYLSGTSRDLTVAVPKRSHPIDILVDAAETKFQKLLAKESHSLEEAAAAYRKRRGRHPPPGFKEWYQFAVAHEAVMVEDFWDQIYHDLEPFWALPGPLIRREAQAFEMTINIRGGKASAGSDWFWTQIWLKLIRTIEHLLPDMDIALNAMDEPRLVVPRETIDEYMATARETRVLKDPSSVVSEFEKLPPKDKVVSPETVRKLEWEDTRPFWKIVRRGCANDSLARQAGIMTDFDHPPTMDLDFAAPHMYHGYVANYTLSTDFCHQPDLQGLNGIFVYPLSVKSTDVLIPLFGGSKLAVNNEILLPAPMYWNEEERFTGGPDHGVPWRQKKDGVVWRGVATGGRNTETNWRAFQRHRFVAMNNGTKLARAEQWAEAPNNFVMPGGEYALRAQEKGALGDWVSTWANVSFTDLFCYPKPEDGRPCNYTGPYFAATPGLKMRDQFAYKYLPDIDGNSFSGRYLGFLRSTSLPIKATLWREWHDSRLVPWKHFVPMDNRYADWYAIMQYFLGYGDEVPGHDAVAERIATAGKEWAERALRPDDMQIYVHRLLLEYARVSDPRRESMGWVEDLL
ncbi:hypothetical protein VTK73DRAFT_8926 [Phialemonium thermophilum]|uniref:Glycosyl transferase CAP10 domain-containing protein n=1 Tax=Phialemonium thermophilum TaxID=223376 RepID=A0ABR3W5G2_9PEZI